MAGRYRVKEFRSRYTPQRKVLGLWISMAPAQPTMEAANAIIRERIRAHRPPSPDGSASSGPG